MARLRGSLPSRSGEVSREQARRSSGRGAGFLRADSAARAAAVITISSYAELRRWWFTPEAGAVAAPAAGGGGGALLPGHELLGELPAPMNLEDMILARLARGDHPDDERLTLRLPPAATALIVEYDEACVVVERLMKNGNAGKSLDAAVSILDQCAIDLDRLLTEVRRKARKKNW